MYSIAPADTDAVACKLHVQFVYERKQVINGVIALHVRVLCESELRGADRLPHWDALYAAVSECVRYVARNVLCELNTPVCRVCVCVLHNALCVFAQAS